MLKKPTDQQVAAINMVFNNKVSILTGGPGTGKTFTTNIVLKRADELSLTVRQAAPTGKAAKRMIEATGQHASTIHSLLGCTFNNKGEFVFMHNEDAPIYADLIIIDESSMIDNSLMSDLLKAVDPDKTRVLFVGDTGQLPSVGAGAVLRDLISSKKIPITKLDIIHRNSGKIVEACSLIDKGKAFQPEFSINLEAENPVNLVHINTQTPEQTLSAIKTIVEKMGARGFDMVDDVQTISPVNKRGVLSCESINLVLRECLNPVVDKSDDIFSDTNVICEKYRIGDKIINTKNMKAKGEDKKECLIVNGDIGKIRGGDKKSLIVEFFEPSRTVIIPRSNNKLLGAYCITCHRFQGSESPVIILPLDRSFAYFSDRRWLYTAISRAKVLCITVGDFNAVGMMINNKKGTDRTTLLKEGIVDCFNKYELEKEFAGI